MSLTSRYLLLVLGILISFPLIGLLSLVPGTPVSPVGWIYLLSYVLMVLGMLGALWWTGRSLVLTLAGLTIVFVTVAARLMFPPSGTHMNMMTLPSQTGPRLLNRVLDEQDVVLFGAKAAPYLGAISALEKDSLDVRFEQTFREMRQQGVTTLSPFLTTYLNQQQPNEFDVVIAEPTSGMPPETGILFLHGFGGNFTVQCWLMARAGNQVDAMTVCPSTSPVGDWWNPPGQAILEETLAYLRQRGVERIYLAGLSNGAIGATRLADQLRDRIAGLILISGADPDAAITELPVLLLHGKDDERIPTELMKEYAAAAGPNATYHLFEGDHFLLLKQADRMQTVIVDWLRQQEVPRQK